MIEQQSRKILGICDIKIAVIVPCYKVKKHIIEVIHNILALDDIIHTIYIVDDKCPQQTGLFIQQHDFSPKTKILFNEINQGVGGAVIRGIKQAIKDDIDIVIKMDGDNQMNPTYIPHLIKPILAGDADYTKGNRFFDLTSLKKMPNTRLVGNAALSFLTKLSSGYWNIFDPTNGFIAASIPAIQQIPLDKVSKRYFFESDILFRLNSYQLVVHDIPMQAIYKDEESNLHIHKILIPFIKGHLKNFMKRIFYSYFLRGFSLASIQLIFGLCSLVFGLSFGAYQWTESVVLGANASSGTVMLAALPIILGVQAIFSFLSFDMHSTPTKAYSKYLFKRAS